MSDTKIKPRRGHPRFYELLDQIADLHDRKNANYAKDNDPLSNFRMCEEFGVPATMGTMVRISDKYARITQLMSGKRDEVGESIKDTLQDMAVYALLEIILIEEEEAKNLNRSTGPK